MKQLLLFIVCCLYGISAAAQDIILKRNAEQIEAVVKEITDTDVKYRKFTHTEGVTYSIRRSEVFSITYENGTKDLFADEKPQAVAASYPYPPVSRSYSLGELFDEGGIRGIVIRVSEDGRHGLLLSLVEGKAAWGFINKNPLKEKRLRERLHRYRRRMEKYAGHTGINRKHGLIVVEPTCIFVVQGPRSGLVSSGAKRIGVHMEFREK